MTPAAFVLWGCALLVVYVWAGYPGLLWALARPTRDPDRAPSPRRGSEEAPAVTIVVAVSNEEAALPAKLEDCLRASYPRNKLDVMVASDGSTDGTVRIGNEFARRDGRVDVYVQEKRMGKTAVQNAAVRRARGDVIVFSDVDTRFDVRFLERLTEPFADRRVGCVTGALVWTNPAESAVASGGDVYWHYEHFIWRLESRLGMLAWASGACLAVRREIFKPMETQYGEDCIVPLDVVALGYRVVFQPEAAAYEARITDAGAEFRARVRMTLRSFSGTVSRAQLLNPLRFPRVAWAILSHKLLRWLTPYFLLLLFAANVSLVDRPFYRFTLGVQTGFYLIGGIGYILDRYRVRVPVLSTIYAFCLMNVGVSVGVAKAILGHRVVAYRSEG